MLPGEKLEVAGQFKGIQGGLRGVSRVSGRLKGISGGLRAFQEAPVGLMAVSDEIRGSQRYCMRSQRCFRVSLMGPSSGLKGFHDTPRESQERYRGVIVV